LISDLQLSVESLNGWKSAFISYVKWCLFCRLVM